MMERSTSRLNFMMLALFVLLLITSAQARELSEDVLVVSDDGGGSCRYVGICETESDCAHSCYDIPHKSSRCDPNVGGRGPQCCCLR